VNRCIVWTLAWALAFVTGTGCNRIDLGPRPPADALSVVLVTIDTLRADHVGAYGADFAHTPTLDALSASGVRFETAITATPITLPSHATLLTGQDAPDHGVRHNGTFQLGEEATTLAERFRAGGWATGGFVGAVVLKARYGLDQGFDVYDDHVQGDKAAPGGFVERPAAEVVDAATAWVDGVTGPFFLWVHLYDPHMDHRAPKEWADRFPDRPYDAEIAYADSQVGRLLAHLRRAGRMERTLVVLTSDHGESLGEHGEWTHSSALYDSVLKVPLLLQGAGLPAGRVVPGVVRLKDVAPTVLALTGLPALPEADGEDLSVLFPPGRQAQGRVAYSETLATMLDNGWAPLHSIRTDEWFYVRSPRPELYAMASDRHQLVNLVESEPERARPHQERLDALVDDALADEQSGTTLEVDATTRDQLHALGYAIADGPVVQTGIDPKDGRQYLPILHRAMAAYEAGDIERAEQLFVEVSEKLPGSGRTHSQLASIYYHDGRHKRALRHIELAISFDPRTALHHAVRAEILLAMGDSDGAWAAYQQAIALDPEAPWSKVGLMWEALRKGERTGAQRLAREAMDDDPGNTGVFLRVASLWAEQEDYEEAARVLEEALRTNPRSRFTRMRLAIEYARTARPELALAERERAGHFGTSRKLGTVLGRAFASVGDFDRAEAQLHAVLAEHPDAKFARESLSRVQAWRAKRGAGAADEG
jgi:arylsulfatase A-like enzyme/tetratricopeptide (TPR) repeat protein